MNLSQYVTLKMGNKFIFKEPLQSLKSAGGNSNYMNPNMQKNNYYSPNNYNNNNQRNLKKRNYQGMDIIPKFIANENMQELNKELLDRLLKKKGIFNKMMSSYFSEGADYFTNSIQEVEMEMNNERLGSESSKNRDYEGFLDLLSFINSNRTNPKLTTMQNITLDDYKNMNNETKNTVLGGIYENKPLFEQKLKLKYTNNKNNGSGGFGNNPYLINNNNQRPRGNSNNNKYNNNKKQVNQRNLVTKDQIDLFKIFIGNQNISNNDALSYFDLGNPKVIIAADRYFKKLYGLDTITLQFIYPYQQKVGTKIHKFRLITEISELFMTAHKDYLSLNNPRLYMENGREIKDDKRIKCIGALGIQNNSKIKVII